ncbi:MAG: polysaccharide biosynthesis C-terminal domain-containing protein [Chitinophagaceae bacterium]|nr:polysaccharide biosynthesis C-terminal domain-containing protein [Chitinophagaceae bacterium]
MTIAQPLQKSFFRSLLLLVVLNLLVKPVWIFAIDRSVQNITGFEAYGHYFSLLNLCIILNFILDLGITSYFNREVASRQVHDVSLFSQALHGKLLLSLLFGISVVMVAWLTGIRDYGLLLLLILLQTGSSLLLFIRAFLTAAQLYRLDAIISITDKLFVIITVGVMILFPVLTGGVTINRFAVMQIAGIAASVILGIVFLYWKVPGFRFRPFTGFRKSLFVSSLPFALNIFLMTLMSRTDGFLLERMHPNGAAEAGIYAAGYRLLDAFNMAGFLMAGFLLPFIARHWPNLDHFAPVLLACRHLLVLGSFWVASFALAAPEYLAEMLYHQDNPYTVFVISMVLQALPALSMVHIYGTTLTATRNIRAFLYITLVFAVLNLLLNLLFIPVYGAIACAIIAVFTQGCYALAVMYFARRLAGIRLWLFYIPIYLSVGILSFTAIRMAVYLELNIPLTALSTAVLITLLFYYTAGASFRQVRELLLEK